MTKIHSKAYLAIYCFVLALLFAFLTPYEAYFSQESQQHGLEAGAIGVLMASRAFANLLVSFFVPALL